MKRGFLGPVDFVRAEEEGKLRLEGNLAGCFGVDTFGDSSELNATVVAGGGSFILKTLDFVSCG